MKRAHKAIILSHARDRNGVYVFDKGGSFRFVKGYSAHPVGAEIDIKAS